MPRAEELLDFLQEGSPARDATVRTIEVRARARGHLRPCAPPTGQRDARGRHVGEQVGRYVLTAELGRGGMGHVFAAHDSDLDRSVAIKFIAVSTVGWAAQFLDEARATARCVHPNIVAVHEIGQHDGAPYLVLEHLDGTSLAQLARDEPLPIPRLVTIMSAVARALECAHSHGIVHRDLKPSNILVLRDDSAKVLDFGISSFAHIDQPIEERTHPSLRASTAGTLPYMAPEQLAGHHVDGRADVWAFGVVLFELLGGVRPFDHLAPQELLAELAELDRPAPSITRHRPDVPKAMAELVARCLEKPRERRCRSATEILAALNQLAGTRTARSLASWLVSAPSPEEGDQVAVGLVQALAKRPLGGGVHLTCVRVWSDLRVELGAGNGVVTAFDDVRTVASLARQAIECVHGKRTPRQRARARRMQQALAPVLRAKSPSRPSARQLARQLASAHSPQARRIIVSLVAAAVLAVLAGVAVHTSRRGAMAVAAQSTLRQLERLEDQMARLQAVGDAATAAKLFDRFVARPESAQVRAAAWLRRSARELAAREIEPALASAAASYLSAPDEIEADRGLAAVLAVQLARRRWDEADQILAEIGTTLAPDLVRASATVAIATRRAQPPSAAVSDGMAVAAHLLVGSPEPASISHAEAIDLDGDGRDEVVAIAGGVLVAFRPGGESLWETPWHGPPPQLSTAVGGDSTCAARDAGGAWFGAAGPAMTRLFRVDTTGAVMVLETAPMRRCELGDLDGDGAAELYVNRNDHVVRHRADPDGTWRATRLALGSEVTALVAADLDGDGRSELAVAAAEWRAYDVRILAGADMVLVDRIRLGRVSALAALARGPGRPPVLLARKSSAWPSARYLPFDQLMGTPDGFYVLRLETGHLRVTGHLAQETSEFEGSIRAADLDGDGRDEGLANERSTYAHKRRTCVLRLDDADDLECTTVEGVSVLVAGRFSDGPADAALAQVHDGRRMSRWWLGLGTTPVPPIPAAASAPPASVPASVDPALATTWRRAARLGRIGATAAAIEGFEQLAATVPPELQPIALAEVLALRVQRGEPVASVYKALAAKAVPGSAAQFAAVSRAVTAALEQGDLATARTVIDAALGSPVLAVSDRVPLQAMRARIEPSEVTMFDGSALDTNWQVLDPVGLQRDPVARTLIADVFGKQPLAAIELARSRGAIGLTVEATITRAEWAAGVRFALRPTTGDTAPLEFLVLTAGGGGVYQLVAEVDGTAVARWPHRAIDSPAALRVHVTWFPDTERVLWDLAIDGVHIRHVAQRAAGAHDQWRLEITGGYRGRDANATRMAMAITKVVVAGVEPIPVTQRDPLTAARLALANGDHAQVRALLSRREGPEASLIAAVRALRADELGAAVAALRRVRGVGGAGPSTLRLLAHLLRVEDGVHAGAVSTAAGGERLAALSLAWTVTATQHPDSVLVQRQLTQTLRDLELPTCGAQPLLLLRASAHVAIGELAEAAADLDTLLAPASPSTLPASVRAAAHLERARVAVRRGADAQAAQDLLAALTASPWPESVADLALLDPDLTALAARHDLERVFALGRPLATP